MKVLRRIRIRLLTRNACLRIAILIALLAAVGYACYRTMIVMPGKSWKGPLPPITLEEQALRDALRNDVNMLAVTIGERNVAPRYEELLRAENWLVASLGDMGYPVARQTYAAGGKQCANVEAQSTGTEQPGKIVVVGAHYDSVTGTPGANDNASGAAAVLALARAFKSSPTRRTLRFVLFANEEPPFCMTEEMGSLVYARACKARADDVVAMLSLETIGYYTNEPDSQEYPLPALRLLYPSVGNFAGFIGDTSCIGLVRRCVAAFRNNASFPSQGAAIPGFITGVNWSDHWSFGQVGYPAIMVTDTAFFRYKHYHQTTDTPDKIDFDSLARVVKGLEAVVTALANEQ